MPKPRPMPSEEDMEDELEPITPLARSSSGSESELDEYIHLGEPKPAEDDLFGDEPPDEPAPDEEEAPIPRIERDTKLEEEIEQEKYVPIEELIADIHEVGLTLDPVRMYLRDIGRHPLLSADEELELARRIKVGVAAEAELEAMAEIADDDLSDAELDRKDTLELDVVRGREAHNQLAQSNLRLVVSVAKRYIGRGLNFLDLIQEGNLGLLRAVDKFDHTWASSSAPTPPGGSARRSAAPSPTRRARSASPCTWWRRSTARRAPSAASSRNWDASRPTKKSHWRWNSWSRTMCGWCVTRWCATRGWMGRLPGAWSARRPKVRRIQRLSQEPLSLETPVGAEENSFLGDFIEDDSLPGPVDSASRRLLKEQMEEILDGLSDRERKVLIMRFGLEDGVTRTLEDVGKEFNVTRERVRQIEAKALRKLRHPLRSRKLRDYLA
jgi:RNA polymerase primary sigma factor